METQLDLHLCLAMRSVRNATVQFTVTSWVVAADASVPISSTDDPNEFAGDDDDDEEDEEDVGGAATVIGICELTAEVPLTSAGGMSTG